MRSRPIISHKQSTLAWRTLVCLAMLAMLCRSVIPLGYMPDRAAAQDGKLLLTLCNGGTAALLISLTADSASPPPITDDATGGLDCPFGLFASQAVLPGEVDYAVVPLASVRIPPPPGYRSVPALPATGPPLGSRAPPFHLA